MARRAARPREALGARCVSCGGRGASCARGLWATLADDGALIVTVWEDRHVAENGVAFAFLKDMGGEIADKARHLGVGGAVTVIHRRRDESDGTPCTVDPMEWEIFGIGVFTDADGAPRPVLSLIRRRHPCRA